MYELSCWCYNEWVSWYVDIFMKYHGKTIYQLQFISKNHQNHPPSKVKIIMIWQVSMIASKWAIQMLTKMVFLFSLKIIIARNQENCASLYDFFPFSGFLRHRHEESWSLVEIFLGLELSWSLAKHHFDSTWGDTDQIKPNPMTPLDRAKTWLHDLANY